MKYRMKEVLSFSIKPKARSTVKKYYDLWREEHSLPYRCDNEKCAYYTQKLEWNGQELRMILDHINGNNKDNRAENLRYLCPNCDSQLPTRGGKNIGRIINESEGGFQVQSRDGKLDTLVAVKTAELKITS